MKRKNEEVPGFDEIIFENRNKEYGAYDLRKHYYSTASMSILGGIAFCGILLAAFSFSTETGIASYEPNEGILVLSDVFKPEPVRPDITPPPGVHETVKNIAPEVSSDSTEKLPPLATTAEILQTTENGDPDDTVRYIEPTDPLIPTEPVIYVNVKEMPEFPGGTSALMKYISDNLSYPEEAVKNNMQGRVVLKFVVRADGSVGRIEIVGGVDPSLNDEAIRVVKNLPAFKPGKQNGIAVPVWFVIPVLFKLQTN